MDFSDNTPKISIVTPVFNRVKSLRATIESILSQGYPNLEYIIIDGGSTDGSVDVIKEYEDKLKYWVSEPDNGVYDAIIKGFKHSTGEVMTWLGSDDMLYPKSLYSVAEIFETHKNIEWLTGATTIFDERGRTIHVSKSRYFNRLDLLSGDYKWIQQESTFWRRSLYDKAGGLDASYRLAGDFDLWLRFTRHTKLFVYDGLIGGFRFASSGQLSDNMSEYDREVAEIVKRELAIYPESKKQLSSIYWKRRYRHLVDTIYDILTRRLRNGDEKKQRLYFDRDKQKILKPYGE